jgi:hypothetical protein
MSYRGALIFPITAEIGRLDLTATAADPDGAGPMVSGYDADYREPVVTPSGDGLGVINRRELMVKVPAQVDGLNTDGDDLQRLQMLSSGDTKMNVMTLVFHFVDLERLGLVDLTSGRALLKEGDRLNALYRPTGQLIQTFPNPPGLFARDASPIGIGFDGQRNLLRIIFQSRDQGGPG